MTFASSKISTIGGVSWNKIVFGTEVDVEEVVEDWCCIGWDESISWSVCISFVYFTISYNFDHQ